jgi:hypothetical protein
MTDALIVLACLVGGYVVGRFHAELNHLRSMLAFARQIEALVASGNTDRLRKLARLIQENSGRPE